MINMKWQDVVMGFVQMVFLFALIPTIVGDAKPELATSLMTGGCLMVMCICFSTLRLWWSAFVVFAVSLGWFVIATQTILGG